MRKHLKIPGPITVFIVILSLGFPFKVKGMPKPLIQPAIISKHATKSVLLAVTTAGTRLIAVGERGIILLSDDKGMTWRQAAVPVSVSLTAVQFVTPQIGWVVGHFGVVLISKDGGETWEVQLNGIKAAQLLLESAKNKMQRCKEGSDSEVLEKRIANAQFFVADGPDKPFLNLYFENEQNGFIIGAYNMIFRTEDGGKSWEPWMHHVENQLELHLYSIKPIGKELFMVGEQGLLLHSVDNGETFRALSPPYCGSYFGCVKSGKDLLLVFGLRGNAFLSSDHGETWQKINTGVYSSLTAGKKLHNGTVVLVTSNGTVLRSSDQGRTFHKLIEKLPMPFSDVVEAEDGSLILVGMQGVIRIKIPNKMTNASTR